MRTMGRRVARIGLVAAIVALTVGVGAGVAHAAGTTFTVINTNPSGAGSLRQAIIDANTNPNPDPGADEIVFNIPGPGVHTIAPQKDLPPVTAVVDILGDTQPGYSG